MPTLIRNGPLLFVLLTVLSPQPALAVNRLAILVSANTGWRQDPPLSYAENDARRLRAVLLELGGFEADAIILLTQPTTDELRTVLDAVKQRLTAIPPGEETRFVFYYSGHADEQYLHLSGARLSYAELYQSLQEMPATVKLGILDTCRSGAILNSKGGARADPFHITVQNDSDVRGTIILTSSNANELSQEAEALGGSFFTHYLVSGLRGAADEDSNRLLSLKEVYGYTFTRTRLATAVTPSGPQSPNFINELKGQGELTLTHLNGPVAFLLFPPDGRRCFVTDVEELRMVAEIIPQQGSLQLALPPGQHRLKCVDGEKYRVAQLDLRAGERMDVTQIPFAREAPIWGMTSIKASPLLKRLPSRPPRTGSRLTRGEEIPAAPLALIMAGQLSATGRASLGEIFQLIPEQSNALNSQIYFRGDDTTGVNLRGLGTERTLVLVNGRRHMVSGTGAIHSVNLNAIPIMAIERIEVLKAGGSAIYGSGAIAGVVNLITKNEYSGTELRGLAGLTGLGDGLSYGLSLVTGQHTARGGLLLAAEYSTQKSELITPQERVSAYTTGGLRLGSNSRAFLEASYSYLQEGQWLAAEPLGTGGMRVTISGNRLVKSDDAQELSAFRVVTGLEGKLSSSFGPLHGFTWDITLNHGRTQDIKAKWELVQRSRLRNTVGPSLIGSSTDAGRCGTPAAPIDDCIPLNLLGSKGSITEDLEEYLSQRRISRGFSQHHSISATIGGEMFKLTPSASTVGVSLGYEHRREDRTNIRTPLTVVGETIGNFYVNEAYAEVALPVLGTMDADLGEQRDLLEFAGAARVFSYNTFGTDFTYQIGTQVSPLRELTARATYSTAFHAPLLARQREQGNEYDPRLQQLSIGTDTLDSHYETANILTMGIAFEPRFFKDFSVAVDYFDISVKDHITRLGEADYIRDPGSNRNGDQTAGLDFFCSYEPRTSFGFIELSLVATRLHTLYLERARRTIDWEANFRLRWTYNAFSASTNVHWINVFKDCMQNSCTIQEEGAPQPPSRQVPGHYAMDANVAYNWELLAGTATVQLGVDNLFDEMPAYVGNGSKAISDLTVYDFMDRYFYMRLSYSYD